jgi:hypothetical protein
MTAGSAQHRARPGGRLRARRNEHSHPGTRQLRRPRPQTPRTRRSATARPRHQRNFEPRRVGNARRNANLKPSVDRCRKGWLCGDRHRMHAGVLKAELGSLPMQPFCGRPLELDLFGRDQCAISDVDALHSGEDRARLPRRRSGGPCVPATGESNSDDQLRSCLQFG